MRNIFENIGLGGVTDIYPCPLNPSRPLESTEPLSMQLAQLYDIAGKLGLYKAADFLIQTINNNPK
jgi:hypothetical protein